MESKCDSVSRIEEEAGFRQFRQNHATDSPFQISLRQLKQEIGGFRIRSLMKKNE